MRRSLMLGLVVSAIGATGLEYEPGRGGNTLEGPLTVNGAVTMTTGPMAINGALSVTGATTFSQPPTGLVRKGELVRGASLGLSIGCASLGTVAVSGVTTASACAVTYRPSAVTLGAVLDCYVTAPGTVTVRACALVALTSAPAGAYGVTLVGQ